MKFSKNLFAVGVLDRKWEIVAIRFRYPMPDAK